MSIAAVVTANKAAAGDKNDSRFTAAPAASYPAHETNAKVTIGADVYISGDKVRTAFGKRNPYELGVLPILIVVQNDSDKALNLDRIKVEYIPPAGGKVAATPASEVRFLNGPNRPEVMVGPAGTPKIRRKKNPLDTWEIEGRAFAAKMIPPGESVHGFFYFQTGFQRHSKVYLNGIAEAGTGKELFYFEIPLESAEETSPKH